jgi:NDP-sugar pyrophosphorylase family protein
MESLFTLAPLLQGGPFVLFTVDTVFREATLARFLTGAATFRDAQAVLALTRFSDDEKPLRVDVGRDHRVRGIGAAAEGAAQAATVSAGFYRFDPAIFDLMDRAREMGLSALRQFLVLLLESEYALYGVTVAKTIDVDRPGDIAKAESLLRNRRGGLS